MGLQDLPEGAAIAIGIIVGLCSTSIQSLGLTLQRKSHILEDVQPEHVHRRPPYRRRRWQIGMTLFIISNLLGSSVQITVLPLVILSPLQASGLVFNTLFATLILKEAFTRWSFLGTLLVCIGAGLIATFGAHQEPAHSLNELLALLNRRPFIIWMIGTGLIIGTLLSLSQLFTLLGKKARTTAMVRRYRMLRGISYGSISGVLSAHCLLLAKSAVELVVRTIVDRNNQFKRWQSWAILFGLAALAITQLYFLHRGLKLCSTSVLYPLVFMCYNIVAILDAIIYYDQASQLRPLYSGLIGLGTFTLLSGVFALSWRLNDEPTAEAPGTALPQTALSPGVGFLNNDTPHSPNVSSALRRFTGLGDNDDGNDERGYEIIRKTHSDLGVRPSKKRRQRRKTIEAQEILDELEANSESGDHMHRPRRGTTGAHGQADERTSLLRKGT